MTDDAFPLRTMWMSEPSGSENDVSLAVDQVLSKDRRARARERQLRIGGLVALAFLVPILLWAAAYGVAPLIRGAYALMAVGCAAMVAAEWLYLEWSRQALPGPADSRSQLQRAAFMLARQIQLVKTMPLWSSPVFVGVALIAFWLYSERTHAAGLTLGAVAAGAWSAAGVVASSASARINSRRLQVERLLHELQ
jgi:hypothetical protein